MEFFPAKQSAHPQAKPKRSQTCKSDNQYKTYSYVSKYLKRYIKFLKIKAAYLTNLVSITSKHDQVNKLTLQI
jgi:hypothetical protein